MLDRDDIEQLVACLGLADQLLSQSRIVGDQIAIRRHIQGIDALRAAHAELVKVLQEESNEQHNQAA